MKTYENHFWITSSRKMKIIHRFNLLVTVIVVVCAIGSSCTKLRLLMSVFRHGDRYPMAHETTRFYYPRNPHANVDWFPDSYEMLTADGKRNAFELGISLREIYGEWLGPTYSRNLVEFRSSHPIRCTITAQLVAAGLFPPVDSQKWNQKLNWQPIPVMPVQLKNNVLFFGNVLCMNYYLKYLKTSVTNPQIIGYNREMREFYTFISNHTGAPVDNTILYYLYMDFLALVSSGLEPPEWTNGIFPQGKLREAAIMQYFLTSWNDDLKRLSGGVWLKEWLDHVDHYLNLNKKKSMESKRNKSIKKKGFFYGGHDINIAGIMITLGTYYRHVPNYTSAINFELHEDDNHQLYVKVLHRAERNFTEQLVPGCDNILCPLETFKDLLAKVIPQNITEECGINIGQRRP